MGIDYESGTTFYERFELGIKASELFPIGMNVEIIPWQGNCFNITKITSYESEQNKTRYYKLINLTDKQKEFLRNVIAKHYIRYRKFMLLTEGDFVLEEDISKYQLHMNDR